MKGLLFLGNEVISHRFMLACYIPLDRDFVALLSVALLFGVLVLHTFNTSVEG